MELSVSIVLMIGLVFVCFIGLKVFLVWSKTNAGILIHQFGKDHEVQVQLLKRDNEVLAKAVHNWKYRYNKALDGYDVEPDDDDLLDQDYSNEGEQISDLVKLVWKKMPPSIAKIIDEPSLQEAIIKGATKNPKALESLISKFTKEGGAGANDQTKVPAVPYGV